MKKHMFDINFDPCMQPGYESRNVSLDDIIGSQYMRKDVGGVEATEETTYFQANQNLAKAWKSQTTWQTLPSRGKYRSFDITGNPIVNIQASGFMGSPDGSTGGSGNSGLGND